MGRLGRSRASTETWSGISEVHGISEVRDTLPDPAAETRPRLARGSQAAFEVGGEERPDRLGPYRIGPLIGEGGTARVYRAEHSIIGKQVAIKTLLPQLARFREAHEMFVREARIASSIRHRNLADVYDFATDDRGHPYYVMELVLGESLASRLEREPLLLSQALDLAIRVTEGVAAVHAAGYIHRDIKSENVLLTRDGRRWIPKLIDFGIARPIEAPAEEEPLGMVGTPRTMAPEQISQDAIDERTDIWGLGVLLYEMLTGELPFSGGGTVREDLVAIVTEPMRPLPAGLPRDVRALVAACLSKDPEQRPACADDLADELSRARTNYLQRHDMIERALAADEASKAIAQLAAEMAADDLAA